MGIFLFMLSACKNANTSVKIENNDNENCQKSCCQNSRIKDIFEEIQFTDSDNTLNDSLLNLIPDSNMRMAYIPEGTFDMGQVTNMALKRELPCHRVKVNAFVWIFMKLQMLSFRLL